MVTRRSCAIRMPDGRQCGSPPLREGQYCLFHDPAHAQEAQEARRLGGLRRKREVTVAGAYDFEGLGTVPQLRRLLEIAAVDALALDNGLGRVRALIAVVGSGTKLIEVGEIEERLEVLEQAVLKRDRAEMYEGTGAWDDGLDEENG